MGDNVQIHEIYCMKDDKLKKMVELDDYLESLAEIHKLRKRVAELEAQVPKWISVEDRPPDVLEVKVKLLDGSEVNCWAQSDGDFYWKCGGSEVFISEHQVTHWIPQPPKEQNDE